MGMGILIGTALLWGLNALLVLPLTNLLLSRKMAAAGVGGNGEVALPTDQQEHWQGVATTTYILVDVLVLSLAGFIGGLLGYYFIGISFEAKGWPGMIAFIALSFVGLGMRGG